MSLFEELKRRGVIRVAMAYLVFSWLVVQVIGILMPMFDVSVSIQRSVVLLLAVGFIPAIFMSWAYDITPEGVKKDGDADKSASGIRRYAKRLNLIIMAAAVGVATLIVWQQIIQSENSGSVQVASSSELTRAGAPITSTPQAAVVDDMSIAVLPFIALSSDKDDEFFGKGIAEELLNSLTQFPELKVAARTSAFSFGNKDVDLRVVGEQLGVAHILEGSVRRSGDRLRITAQLIRALDGFHLWSQTYERKDTDIFAIQDEIVSELSEVLQFRLGVGKGAGRADNRNVNPRAYEDYLRGLDLWWNRALVDNRDKAVSTFKRVTDIAPDFADGWAAYGASLALSRLRSAPTLSGQTFHDEINNALTRALELDPNNVRAHAARVFVYCQSDIDIAKALQHMETGLALVPNDAFMLYAAAFYFYTVGDLPRSIEYFDRMVALDPFNQTTIKVRFVAFVVIDRYAEEVNSFPEFAKCPQGECRSVHALWALLLAAITASSEDEIIIRRDNFQEYERESGRGFEWLSVISYHLDSLLGKPVDPDFWQTVDFSDNLIQESSQIIAGILAQHGEETRALELLFNALESTGETFNSVESLYALSPGRLEIPESLRRHPRYHEYWNLPGMAELAEARRANGLSNGLPLPPNETE